MADLNSTGPVNGSVAPQSSEVRTRTPDRRCSRRIAFVLPIEVRGESPFNTRTVRGTTQNLSANGMSFVCGERYLPGQLLYITMKFGDQAQGTDSFAIRLQFRVQRLEQAQRNDSEQFAVALALDI
jgi:c-di-GMP-binding flagellar brake protein YcgR